MRERFSFFGVLLLGVAGCKTYTPLDLWVYPDESYWTTYSDDEDAAAICSALEDQGYQLDDLYISESGQEVQYPDGEQRRFPTQMSIGAIIITDIHRDYDLPKHVSNEEQQRLDESAIIFCEDYQAAEKRLGIDMPLSRVMYWDWIVGLRGSYQFSEMCEIVWQDGWGAGSYAHAYEIDPAATCPSEHVTF